MLVLHIFHYLLCTSFTEKMLYVGESRNPVFSTKQDLGRQTLQTRFLLDIYVLKTMIYCLNRFFFRKSYSSFHVGRPQ